jgi:putative nucleotidyltransferase with HDIG domain/PAS domain S-box-containing protein
MIWQSPHYMIFTLLSGAMSSGLALLAWRRRATVGAREFMAMMLAVAVWSLGYAAQLATPDLAWEVLWEKVEFAGIVSVPVAWLIFTLRFSRHTMWLAANRIRSLAVIPAVTLLLMWTNELHGLVYARVWQEPLAPFGAVAVTYGPWFWVHAVYSYSLLLLGCVVLFRRMMRTASPYREQAALVLASAVIPLGANVMDTVGLQVVDFVELTPMAFSVTGLMVGWALFRLRFLDLAPIARDAIMESLTDAVLVLDADSCLVDANPAALRILGVPSRQVIGRPVADVLAAWPEMVARYVGRNDAHEEISVGEGPDQRWYDLRISPLGAASSRATGRLVVLRDVSEHRQVADRLSAVHDLGQQLVLLGDRTEIARSVVAAARSVLNIPLCVLLLVDPDTRTLVQWAHTAGPDALPLPPLPLDEGQGITVAVVNGGKAVYVPDVRLEPRYVAGLMAARSELCVPLGVGGRVIGALNAESDLLDGFRPADIQLLEALASEAAIALENARLLEEARHRAEEFAALYHVSRELATETGLTALLRTIVQQATVLTKASMGFIYLYDAARDDLTAEVAQGEGVRIRERIAMGKGFVGTVARTRQPLIVSDYAQWEGRLPEWRRVPIRTVAGVPLVFGGALIGVLGVREDAGSTRQFTENDLRLLTLIAGHAANVVHDSRLLDQVKRRVDHLALINELGREMMRLKDLGSLLDYAVDGMVVRLGYQSASVFRAAEGGLACVAGRTRGLAGHPVGLLVPTGQGIVGYAAREARPLLCPDVSLEPRYFPCEALSGTKSELSVPILSGSRVLGVLDVQSLELGGLDEADSQVLQALAAQLSTAIENARLFAETGQRLAELEAVNRVSAALRAAQNLDEMLPILLDEMLSTLNTTVGLIALNERVAGGSRGAVARGWMEGPDRLPRRPDESLLTALFVNGEACIAREFHIDPRQAGSLWPSAPAGWGGVLAPIRTAQTVIGVLAASVNLPREIQPGEVRLLGILAEIAGSAIQRTRLHEQTQLHLQRLMALHTIDMAISASVDLGVTLSVLLDQVTTQLRVEAADILVLDPHTQSLQCAASRGAGLSGLARRSMRVGEGLAGQVVLDRRVLHISDLGEARPGDGALRPGGAMAAQLADALAAGFRSYYAVPVIAKGQVKGVLEVFSRSRQPADQSWLDYLQSLAAQTAIAIDNATLFDGLQRSNEDLSLAYDTTLEGWARALELRDRETEGHTERVADLTLRLARSMGMAEADLVHVRRGALLHDIGKMAVPDSVLLKPGPLSDEEWVIMREHPAHAFRLLSPIAFLKAALDVPYCHHEKWDGTGYPRGLRAEQIPLSARVFAVIDVWDALRSDRPYRPAWSEERTIAFIREQAGTHFDPTVARAFLSLQAAGAT